ncbi:hypothetical protein ACFQX7_31780 [Luedemannella flava]
MLRHGGVPGQPEIPRGRRHRRGVLVRVEAHPDACRAHVDNDLGRQRHDAPGQRGPSISEGASNHAVATPSTTRQSVPIAMPGTVEPIPDDRLPSAMEPAGDRSGDGGVGGSLVNGSDGHRSREAP